MNGPIAGVKTVRSFLGEFRTFAVRGNVVDLAVGVVIGAAFNKIVSSLVEQMILPPIGLLIGGIDFSKLQWVIRADDPKTPAVDPVAIQYGAFLNTIVQFVIVAFAVFLMVKLVNKLRESEAAAPAPPEAPTTTEKLLSDILAEMKARGPQA